MAQRDEVEMTILQSNMSVFIDEHKEATDEFETSPNALVEQIARMRPAEFDELERKLVRKIDIHLIPWFTRVRIELRSLSISR